MNYGKLDENFNVIKLGMPVIPTDEEMMEEAEERLRELDQCMRDRWMEQTYVGEVLVSTVFLAIEHGEDMWFETCINREGSWDVVQRYSTHEQAVAGHEKYVRAEKRYQNYLDKVQK